MCDCIESGKPLERNGHTSSCNREQRKEAERAKRTKIVIKELKKVSPKMAAALKEYSKLKKRFLQEHPMCAVYTHKAAVDIHHKAGRASIELLLDTSKWLAVSREGHIWIENNPIKAKELGFSEFRLVVDTKLGLSQ